MIRNVQEKVKVFCASTANIVCNSNATSHTFAYPINRGKVWLEPASGVIPTLENGVWNVLLSEAKTTSTNARVVTPTPIAGPLTTAMMGFGNFINA